MGKEWFARAAGLKGRSLGILGWANRSGVLKYAQASDLTVCVEPFADLGQAADLGVARRIRRRFWKVSDISPVP